MKMKTIYTLILTLAVTSLVVSCGSGSKTIEKSKLQVRKGIAYEVNKKEPFTGTVTDEYTSHKGMQPCKVNLIINVKDGKRHGLSIRKQDGEKIVEAMYENGQKNGKYIEKYNDNKKCIEATFKNGKLDGELVAYYGNGQKRSVANFKNNKLEGPCVAWYDNGQKAEEGDFVADKIVKITSWKKNGEEITKKNVVPIKLSFSWTRINLLGHLAALGDPLKL